MHIMQYSSLHTLFVYWKVRCLCMENHANPFFSQIPLHNIRREGGPHVICERPKVIVVHKPLSYSSWQVVRMMYEIKKTQLELI